MHALPEQDNAFLEYQHGHIMVWVEQALLRFKKVKNCRIRNIVDVINFF